MPDKKYVRRTLTYNGKRYERVGQTAKEADQKIGELKASLKRGDVGISSSMPLRNWLATWLDTYIMPSSGEQHYKSCALYARKISDEIGGLTLRHVNDVHFQRVLNDAQGMSKSYVHKLYLVMKMSMKQAYLSRLITSNPVDFIKMPKADAGKRRSVTPVECKHILELAETHRAGLWLKIMLYAGLRPGECRALQWRHVDFAKRLIHVEQAIKAGTNTIGSPKSSAGTRYIPIPDALYDALYPLRGVPFAFVLTTATGRPYTKTALRDAWMSFRRELDLAMGAKTYRNKITLSVVAPDLVPYCLRHTYGTDMQTAGVDINITRALMGHEDITTTSKVYVDITDDTLAEVAKKISQRSRSG